MDFLIIFIVLMLAIFAFVGWIVYWAISHSAKKNKVYQAFASSMAINLIKHKVTTITENIPSKKQVTTSH